MALFLVGTKPSASHPYAYIENGERLRSETITRKLSRIHITREFQDDDVRNFLIITCNCAIAEPLGLNKVAAGYWVNFCASHGRWMDNTFIWEDLMCLILIPLELLFFGCRFHQWKTGILGDFRH